MESDADWSGLFVAALTDFVLADDTSPGNVDAEEASYLIEKIGSDGQIDTNELALLVNIAASATGESPEFFNQFTLDAVKAYGRDKIHLVITTCTTLLKVVHCKHPSQYLCAKRPHPPVFLNAKCPSEKRFEEADYEQPIFIEKISV